MPKKRTDGFQKLTIEQQQEIIDRRKVRAEVSQAITLLAMTVLAWVIDREVNEGAFLELFHANGHRGEYHEVPSVTTFRRVSPQSLELTNIAQRLKDTPLDYMGAVELSYVYERIMMMIELLQSRDPGTIDNAITLYKGVGAVIRQKVFDEMGHYPEQFPIPHGRITGDEEPTQFKLVDHQPPLF